MSYKMGGTVELSAYPLAAICPHTLLHNTEFTDPQLLVHTNRIGRYDVLVIWHFAR